MKGSHHITTISGIPLKIHWSFGLLLLWVVYQDSKQGFDPVSVVSAIIIVLSFFVCVILHEFGHAFAARRFGVKTFDIIMTPIGGIARLERMPEGKGQEFWVAIAGPFVNFMIAGIIWLGFLVFAGEVWPDFSGVSWTLASPPRGYFIIIMGANLGLGIFNLIPAFPMDGGRILRSLLSLRMDRSRATKIASYAGQAIAIAMFGWGLYTSQPIMTLIGVFIFFAARQENMMLQRQTLMTKMKASELMDPVEHNFFAGQMMSAAKEIAKSLKGESFIVWSRPGIPAGYITRDSLDMNKKEGLETSLTIDAFVIPSPAVVSPETSVGQLFSFMQYHKIPVALVAENNHYIGVIPWKKIADLLRN